MEVTVAITGASGVQYGIRLLEALKKLHVETILIVTQAGRELIDIETNYSPDFVTSLGTRNYDEMDFKAPIASGSYLTNGMVVVPCSMKTLGSIANGISGNLVTRAAEVCLKEGRKLILVPRETPLTLIHLGNMMKASRAGATILPACPALYTHPTTIEALIDIIVARILDKFEIKHSISSRWSD
jgi:4-hydroxy-3-polyprenylbenzoate decarboxylase